MLNGHWSGHTLLHLAWRTLFTVAGGHLIIDDMAVEKPYTQRLGEAAWVWSSKPHKVVFGVSVVLLVWTDGQSRIPVAFRVWHKGGLSKFDLALELLSYARNRLQCKPQFVLFDSWYPSKYCALPHLIPHDSKCIVMASALLQALWHQPGVRKGPEDAARHIVVGYRTTTRTATRRRAPHHRPPRLCVTDHVRVGFSAAKFSLLLHR